MRKLKDFFKKRNVYITIAVLIGMALSLYFLVITRFGIKNVDESFYLSVPYRFLNGDSPLADEWHVTQSSGLLLMLPMKLFLSVTGSTDGIILFFRQLYIIVKLIFYIYICVKLRSKRYWGLFAAVMFSVFDFLQYAVLNYYTMTALGAVVVGFILFDPNGEKPKKGRLIFAGGVFACMVVAEPPVALLYFSYAAAVLIFFLLRKKKKNTGGYPFDINTFLYLTAGIFIVFVVFVIYFLCSLDIGALAENFSMLFTDSEYRLGADGGNVLDLSVISGLINLFGVIPLGLCVVLFFAGTVLVKNGKLPVTVVVIGHLLIFTYELLKMLIEYPQGPDFLVGSMMLPMIFSTFGLGCFLLTQKKDMRQLYFWLYCLLLSLPVDIGSDCAVFSCMCVSCIPSVLMIKQLFSEIGTVQLKKRGRAGAAKKVSPLLFAVTLCLSAVLLLGYLHERTGWVKYELTQYNESGEAKKTENGPLKGLYTSPKMAKNYELVLKDLDYIKSVSDGVFYVSDLCPWYYIYSETDIGTYTAYYVQEDGISRNKAYWSLHPDKIPDMVFVPFFDAATYYIPDNTDDLLDSEIFELFDGEVKKLNTGFLIENAKYKG